MERDYIGRLLQIERIKSPVDSVSGDDLISVETKLQYSTLFSVNEDGDIVYKAWVEEYVAQATIGFLDDRGNYDASGNVFPSTDGSGPDGEILKGDLWTISVAGTLGGTAVTPGDIVRALVDNPGQTGSNWAITTGTFGYVPANDSLSNLASVAINTSLIPGTSDGAALGSGTKMWSDLYLASGGVVNWDNGNVTLTHSAGLLTLNSAFTQTASNGSGYVTTITNSAGAGGDGLKVVAGGLGNTADHIIGAFVGSTELAWIDASGKITATNGVVAGGALTATTGTFTGIVASTATMANNDKGYSLNATTSAAATTSIIGYSSTISTPASAFTLPQLYNFSVVQGTFGAGSTVTNQYGYHVSSNFTGATNNYAFHGNLASGSGRWNLYMAGTAANYLGGALEVVGALTGTSATFTDGSQGLKIQAYTGGAGYGAIYGTDVTPGANNYALVAKGTQAVINGSNTSGLNVGGTGIVTATASAVTLSQALTGTSATFTPTSSGASVVAGLTLIPSNSTHYTAAKVGLMQLVGRTSNTDTYWSSNTDLYTATITGASSYLAQNAGNLSWNAAPSVSAGATPSFVEMFSIVPSGIATFSSANAKSNTGYWNQTINDLTSAAAGVGGGISLGGYKTGTSAQAIFGAIDGAKSNGTGGNEEGSLRFWTNNGTNLVTALTISSSQVATFGGNITRGNTVMATDGIYTTGSDMYISGESAHSLFLRTNGTTALTISSAQNAIFAALVRLKVYTVATLPAAAQGDIAVVTDALSPVYATTVVGGGSTTCIVLYNGAAWQTH